MRDTSNFKTELPRSITLNKESINPFFGDASIAASCTAVYTVVHQSSVTNQRLIARKSCISKRNFTISRLGLVSAHLASNLIENVKAALKRCNIRSITG